MRIEVDTIRRVTGLSDAATKKLEVAAIAADKTPLLWQCVGQKQFAAISTHLPLEVTLGNANRPKYSNAEYRDILYFANGDVIPCSLLSMSGLSAKVSTPMGSEAVIPNIALRSVELNASGTKLRHPFTKESREMMLTMPRTGETSLTTHALLGSNGDLLRGSVIAISDQTVEVDSKQEPMVVERNEVVAW